MLRNMAATVAAFLLTIALASHAEAKQKHHRNQYNAPARRVIDQLPTIAVCMDNNGRYLSCAKPQGKALIRYSRRSHSKVVSVGNNGPIAWGSGGSRSVNNYVGQIVSHPTGCPRYAFCGCGVSVKVFGHPVRDLYLASNWFKFPHASPGPGMVAVRNHHVMYIMAVDGNGNATVYDPNSGGHQTRIHTRSLSGYSVRDPNTRRVALR